MRTFLILFLTFAVTVIQHAQAQGEWAKTRWGMTMDQVVSLYPDAKPSSGNDMSDIGGVPKRHISSYMIDGLSYEVDFLFESTGGLGQVLLARACRDDVDATSLISKLTEFLTVKYSAPAETKKSAGNEISTTWITPQSVINLEYSPPSPGSAAVGLNVYIIMLRYYKRGLFEGDRKSTVGWGRTTWGMSVNDILRAYPEATVVPESPFESQMKAEFKGRSAKVEIKNYVLGDEDYRVAFFVTPSLGLHEVNISAHAETNLDNRAAKVQSLLTTKYGTPKLLESLMRGGTRYGWDTPSYAVELNYCNFPSPMNSYIVTVIYKPRQQGVLDRL